MRGLILIAVALAASGCGNSCQQICPKMAAYARDCGYDVRSDEVQACIADQSGVSADDREVCREFGSKETIREQWTCDDVAAYFERGNALDSGSSEP